MVKSMTSPTADPATPEASQGKRPMDEWLEIAKRDGLGSTSCGCLDAYKGRGLTDPHCIPCNYAEDIAAALRQAVAKGRAQCLEIVLREKGESLTGSWDMACDEIEAAIRALPITEGRGMVRAAPPDTDNFKGGVPRLARERCVSIQQILSWCRARIKATEDEP